jgi:hypothetical protein
VHDTLGVHVDDEERKDGPEPHVVDLQEIAGPDRVVTQERVPRLTEVRLRRPGSAHVLLGRALGDADAELEKLTAHPFGSPEAILASHAFDELDDLSGHTWLGQAPPSRSGSLAPEQAESLTVPSQDRVGLHEEQRVSPPRNDTGEQNEQAAFVAA